MQVCIVELMAAEIYQQWHFSSDLSSIPISYVEASVSHFQRKLCTSSPLFQTGIITGFGSVQLN